MKYPKMALLTKEELKKEVFKIFFTDNEFSKGFKKSFTKDFPSVAKIFEFIKPIDHAYLALILQRIESRLVLDNIIKRISIERPEIPLLTIHDSIATTKSHQEYVRAVMEVECWKLIGCRPTISLEEWNPSNLL